MTPPTTLQLDYAMPAKKKTRKAARKGSALKDLGAKSDPKGGLIASRLRIGGPRAIT